MWLDPGFVGENVSLLHAEPAWSVVVSYHKQFFSREACAARQGKSATVNSDVGMSMSPGLGRLLFPCLLEAYCDDETRDWKRCLRLCVSWEDNHEWYVAVARAARLR